MNKLLLALAAALLGAGPGHAQTGPQALPTAAAQAPEEAMFVHVATRGDTYIGLARRYLSDPQRWPELARANAARNLNLIPTGVQVRIPLRLMRTEAAAAGVLHVVGKVTSDNAALQPGQQVLEGKDIVTAADGHATVRLVDGTVLRLRPESRLLLRESRRVRDANAVQSGVRLEQGRVEVQAAPAPAGRPGFRVETPQGVLGVRGTEFRVASEGTQGSTRGEVLGGAVAFEGRQAGSAAATPATAVAAGYGSVIGNSGQVAAPVKLLAAPDISALPRLQEKLLMRFALAPLAGAAVFRGQLAADSSFDKVLADLTTATPELRFADLPDGDYILRVRGVDALGLEGRNADHRFTLKARPEAPLPSAPQPKAVSFGGRMDFAWTANAEAARYRLRLADSADFKTPLRDLKDLPGVSLSIEGLAPGTYFWQLASLHADGNQGPWGAARSFEMRPLPPAPQPPKVGDRGVSFAWEGLPGQTFEFQVARDLAFTQLLLEKKLTEPRLDLAPPGTGRFYVRLRARDPDGFVGPFTTPQFFDIPNCLRDGSGNCVRAGEQTLNLGS